MLVAFANGGGVVKGRLLTPFTLIGPTVAERTLPVALDIHRHASPHVHGWGLLVHFRPGPDADRKMHFYFFRLDRALRGFGNPVVILGVRRNGGAASPPALHFDPDECVQLRGLILAVAVHALFVVLESVSRVLCGTELLRQRDWLEKIVAARTEQLDKSRARTCACCSISRPRLH